MVNPWHDILPTPPQHGYATTPPIHPRHPCRTTNALMTGLEAIDALASGQWEQALEWAREHDVEIPDRPEKMDRAFSYETDARDTFPKRMALIRNICNHLRTTDPDDGIVSGRLEALAEKFRRQADMAKKDNRYEEMDIWIDAETDTKQLIPDE